MHAPPAAGSIHAFIGVYQVQDVRRAALQATEKRCPRPDPAETIAKIGGGAGI